LSSMNTKYFVQRQHDFDAILEYAKQEGFVTTCNNHGEKESYDFHGVTCVDEIIESAVNEGYFEFYENNGTCYQLTEKGVKRFQH